MTNEIVFLMFALIAGHALSVALIMRGMQKVVSELKTVVLERETTNRLIYSLGPEVDGDRSADFYVMEGGDNA
jgi:hypothetical protein|tara:strand:- start:370 stop:588 length:219 start_codon:yes stop_codon:yes gene_type:complete